MAHPRPSRLLAPLLVLSLALHGACAASITGRGEPGDVLPLSLGLWPQGALLIKPGTDDVKNKYLPAVTVFSTFQDWEGRWLQRPCSGVLLHPRLVITAGHCVCATRPPREDEQPPRSGEPRNGRLPLSRAQALAGVTLTAITDKNAPCARGAKVTAIRYGRAPRDEPVRDILGPEDTEVLLHPSFEILKGTRKGDAGLVWANADLAAIILRRPVQTKFQPLKLPEGEVGEGDDILMIGYGTPETPESERQRKLGESRVTRVIPLETGSVIFRSEERPQRDGGPGSHAEPGDSGGPAVSRSAPRTLVGIVSVGAARPTDGTPMTIFMSAHAHKPWMQEMLRRVTRGAPSHSGVPDGGGRRP